MSGCGIWCGRVGGSWGMLAAQVGDGSCHSPGDAHCVCWWMLVARAVDARFASGERLIAFAGGWLALALWIIDI